MLSASAVRTRSLSATSASAAAICVAVTDFSIRSRAVRGNRCINPMSNSPSRPSVIRRIENSSSGFIRRPAPRCLASGFIDHEASGREFQDLPWATRCGTKPRVSSMRLSANCRMALSATESKAMTLGAVTSGG